MSQRAAREAGIDVRTAQLPLRDAIARPWTYETDPRGELAVIADAGRKTLVGAWAVGPLASEWIHYAALAIKASLPLSLLQDTVAQFPTYTEAYLRRSSGWSFDDRLPPGADLRRGRSSGGDDRGSAQRYVRHQPTTLGERQPDAAVADG
jgi:hypothetical protein